MGTRKRRADAFERQLSAEQQGTLRDGLLGAWTYQDAVDWLEAECGVASSAAALSSYWEHYCAPVLRERRQMAVLKAEQVLEAAENDGVDFGAAGMERLRQLTFEFLLNTNGEVDTKEVARLMKLVLADKALSHDARKLKLLEKKAEFAEEVKKVAENKEGGVTAEEMAEIERKLKMM